MYFFHIKILLIFLTSINLYETPGYTSTWLFIEKKNFVSAFFFLVCKAKNARVEDDGTSSFHPPLSLGLSSFFVSQE